MRQRKLKGVEEKLDIYSGGITTQPELQKGRWNSLFDKEQPVYMELGCGKGQFILALAAAYPERNFIAIEGNESVVLRALQKTARNMRRFSDEELIDENGYEKPFEDLIEDGIFKIENQVKVDTSGTVEADDECETDVDTNGTVEADNECETDVNASGMVEADDGCGTAVNTRCEIEADNECETDVNASGMVEADDECETDVNAGGRIETDEGRKSGINIGDRAEIDTENRVERRAAARAKAMAEFVPGYHIVDGKKKKNRRPDEPGNIYKLMPNLLLVNMFVKDITDIFDGDELAGIYLNFSDPWPKARHAKRRLTHTRYLNGYRHILRPGGCLEFKTDNEDLFRFSIEEFEANHLEKLEYTEDLHGVLDGAESGRVHDDAKSGRVHDDAKSGRVHDDAKSGRVHDDAKSGRVYADLESSIESDNFESAKYMTEYEQKFTLLGKPIYYCKVKFV